VSHHQAMQNHSRICRPWQTSTLHKWCSRCSYHSTRKRHLSLCQSASVLSLVWQIWSDQM